MEQVRLIDEREEGHGSPRSTWASNAGGGNKSLPLAQRRHPRHSRNQRHLATHGFCVETTVNNARPTGDNPPAHK
jgi:hypothetical protein